MESVQRPYGRREQNVFEELKEVQHGQRESSNGPIIGGDAGALHKKQNGQDLAAQSSVKGFH